MYSVYKVLRGFISLSVSPKVNDMESSIVTIENDWIYYQFCKSGSGEDYGTLYKIKIDGSQNTKIKKNATS